MKFWVPKVPFKGAKSVFGNWYVFMNLSINHWLTQFVQKRWIIEQWNLTATVLLWVSLELFFHWQNRAKIVNIDNIMSKMYIIQKWMYLFVNYTPLDKIYDLSGQMSICLKAALVSRHDTSKPTVHSNIWLLATLNRPTSSFCRKKVSITLS